MFPSNNTRRKSTLFPSNIQVFNNFNIGKCTTPRIVAALMPIWPLIKAVNKNKELIVNSYEYFLFVFWIATPSWHYFCYLLTVLKHGFDPGVESILSQNVICNNLQSAFAEPDIVDNMIKIIGPFNSPPFAFFFSAPALLEWLQGNCLAKNVW